MSANLKTFYRLELDFKSPLHVGKGSQGDYLGAAEIIHDGSGEYVLPGTSVAGAFLATLQKCVDRDSFAPEDRRLWNQNVTAEPSGKNDDSQASRLLFRTATLTPRELRVRDKVKISRKTKTAEDKAKFSLWEIDPGRVKLLIEIDNLTRSEQLEPAEFAKLEAWVETALHCWQREGVFLGGHTGTGNGHARLARVEKFQLDGNNFGAYLQSSYHDLLTQDGLWGEFGFPAVSQAYKGTILRRFSCTVTADLMNPLLVKGGSSYQSIANPETDSAFISRSGRPFIPGSSFRGAVSTIMDKYARLEWKTLLGQPDKDGTDPGRGGCVIFTDLYLDEQASPDMKLLQIEHHAEDQFSRAVYGSGKFIEERLFNAVFRGEIMVLDCETACGADLDGLFGFLKQACDHGLIALGSGGCHPEITLEEKK